MEAPPTPPQDARAGDNDRSVEALDLEPEARRSFRQGPVRRGNAAEREAARHREVERIDGPEGMPCEAMEQLAGEDGVRVFQGMHLEVAVTHVTLERRYDLAHDGRRDLARAAPSLEEAANLDGGERL